MKRMIKNRMNLKSRRMAAAAVAGLSAAAVVITSVLSGAIEAEAADTLLGIEKLRSRYMESGSEFVILEVAPDRKAAEIGYLVGGYEPLLGEWDEEEQVWKNWRDTLCELPKSKRKAFIEGKKAELREYYKKHGLTGEFPVEAAAAEYEEGEPKQEGFEKIVSDGSKRTGWFQKLGDTPEEGADRYQVAFRYNGLYNGSYEFYEDVLYYNVLSATKIDENLAGGIEDDRPIYTKEGKDIYEYRGTWGEINGAVMTSLAEEDDREEQDDKEEPKPDDGDNDGSEDSSDGNGDDSDGGDGADGGNGDGDGDNGSGSGDGNSDGSDNGNSDGNNGGGADDGNGNGDADNGSGSGSGDSNSDGGADDGSGAGDNGSGSGDSNSDAGADDGNGAGDNGSGSGDSNSDGGADDGNGGGENSGSGLSARVVSAPEKIQKVKWIKMVADGDPAQDSGADADADKKPADSEKPKDSEKPEGSDKPADSEKPGESEKPGNSETPSDPEEPGSSETPSDPEEPGNSETPADPEEPGSSETPSDPEEPGSSETPDDPENPDDPTEPENPEDPIDPDEPAADDPADEEEEGNVTNAVTQESREYYLVAFKKVDDNTEPAANTPMYSVRGKDDIVLSGDGEYEFIEWDGKDVNQGRQEYTFAGKEIWCKNTFKSNEWFKKYVLNMDKADYEKFRIKVLTYTPQELNGMERIPNFHFLYLNSGLREKEAVSDNSTVSGNNGGGGDSENDEEGKTAFDDSVKARLYAADSLPGRWRKLVAAGAVNENTGENGGAVDNGDSAGGNGGGSADNGNSVGGNNGGSADSGDSAGEDNDGGAAGSGDGAGGNGGGSADNGDSAGGNGGGSADNGDSAGGNNGGSADSGDSAGEDNDGGAAGSGDGAGGNGGGSADSGDGAGENGGGSADSGDGAGDNGGGSADSGDGAGENGGTTDNGGGAEDQDGSGESSVSENNSGSDEDSVSENSSGSYKKTNNANASGSVSDNDIGNTGADDYGADNDLSAGLLKYFMEKTVAEATPCLVDGSILYTKDESGSITVNENLKNTNIFRLSAMLCQEDLSEWYEKHHSNYGAITTAQLIDGIVEDADKNFVEEHVYCRLGNGSDSIVNDHFAEATIYQEGSEIEPGFQCVLDEIRLDNLYRESDSSGNYKPLSTKISQAKAVRHILNYRDRRKVETKKEIRVLEIQPAMADEPELSLDQIKAWAPGVENAEITVMTTAEFIGKIEKLNETYDLIYIGTSKDHLNMRYWTDSSYIGKPDKNHAAAGTVFNDADMDGLIYYNIGDLRVVNLPMSGLLTSEYRNGNRGDWTYFYNYVRYGGNDISKEKMNALISFLDGSYPVVIADDFLEQPVTVYADKEYKGARVNLTEGAYTQKELTALGVKNQDISSAKVKEGYRLTVFDGDRMNGNSESFTRDAADFAKQARPGGNWDDKTVSLIVEREENVTPDRAIDEDHIDNCTYLYEFVEKAMKDKYLNFYAKGDIAENSELFKFYLNRPKVSLTETAVGGLIEDGSDIHYINPDPNGKYELQYRFKIQNEGTASYSTRYRCKLYIDVNSDGKFSAQEEIEDITLTHGGSMVSPDDLYADRDYMLTRMVPIGYKGLLPWRVEITQADNPNIYTSLNGYTKLNGMEKEVLKICQINKNGSDVIDLNYEVKTKGRHFNTLVYGGDYDGVHYPGIANDFELDITTIDVNTFQSRYYADHDYLKDFNMLILGFSDMYGDFEGDAENGPMGAIVDFINSGKSVLLGHDTTSFFNSPGTGQEMKGYPWRDSTTLQGNKSDWYYTRNAATLNKYVRPLVGMDRYGILDSDILQRGDVLRKGTGDYDTVVDSGKDVAYKPKSGRKETVPEVHGYTYALISAKDQKVWIDDHTSTKYQYTKWNLLSPSSYGKYPNVVFENKYTNIRFDPAWFWENKDGVETDPARYGELEKVNNGEVWNVHATQVNQGQITEYPYKLKDEFEVALTHAQYYELDYTADDDGDGQSDLVVWYCLGGRTSPTGHSDWEDTIYSQSPNDVRNNYYIYNKGNITYTGMGHARKNWNEEWYTFEEAKLFINTMIASYQAGIRDPQIRVLKSGTPEAEEMKLLYRYYDQGNRFSLNDEATAEGYEKIYFMVQDTNLIKGTRKITSQVFYKDDGGSLEIPADEVIGPDGQKVKQKVRVSPVAGSICSAKDDSVVASDNLTSGAVYYIQVPKSIMQKSEDGLDLYFEAQTTLTTNTVKQNVYTTEKVYAKLQVLQAYLFNLE